jgi:hypothetical protein
MIAVVETGFIHNCIFRANLQIPENKLSSNACLYYVFLKNSYCPIWASLFDSSKS